MSAVVNIGSIQFGGAANQVGVFDGQNMQNAWDSHGPNISAIGVLMGQQDVVNCQVAQLVTNMQLGQPIFDMDVKGNQSPMVEGY